MMMNDQRLAVVTLLNVCFLVMTSVVTLWASPSSGQELTRLPPIELDPPEVTAPAPSTLPAPEAEAEVAAPPIPAGEGEPAFSEPWYYPSVYFASEIWESSLEFGINGSSGNSDVLTYRAGADIKRTLDHHELKLNFTYLQTTTNGVQTQNNGAASMKHDWKYEDSPWSIFWKSRIEYDAFRAFDYRVSTSAGFAYAYIDNERTTLKGRFGPGMSREFGGPDDEYVGEIVWGLDLDHEINDRQTLEATVEYRPEWEMPSDYRIESKVSWAVKLNESGNLSLKTTVTDRYDSTPNGAKANDFDYALLLMWKL